MPSLTRRVTERNVRIDDAAFFTFAATARGRHTGWLREIGRAALAEKWPRFSFTIFEGTKLVGYESNPELHVVLKAIEAHLLRSKKREHGWVTLEGEADTLPRTIRLDYFEGRLTFLYPVWHTIDLSAVELDLPARPGGAYQAGVAYVLRGPATRKGKQREILAAGVVGTNLYVGHPTWTRKTGRTTACGSRAAALSRLGELIEAKQREGFALHDKQPLEELRRAAKGKFPSWSFERRDR